ncbi:MAG: metallophosphoesterase [Acidobacteriota bacterium]
MKNTFREVYFAAVGDVHGHMNFMVRLLNNWESATNQKLDFVLQVGDFEPHRNEADLSTMAAPSKYRKLGDFPDYFTGKLRFPYPLYFIGGNHEPYGFLDQLPSNSKIVENCYYLGRVGKVELAGLTIVGLSGIYREDKFTVTRPSIAEINRRSNKEYIYFTKDEVDKVLEFSTPDILMLHEWPANIIDDSDHKEFEQLRHALGYDDVGNEYSRLIIEMLEPRLVLCGHMHKRYRKRVTLESSKMVDVCCLANVEQGVNSVAIYRLLDTGDLVEVSI